MKLESTLLAAILVGAVLVVMPNAAADATLVDAVASLDASPDHGESDETGSVSFTDNFSDSVSATWSEEGLESASGTQTTSIDLGAGETLIGFSTEANVDSAASGGPDDRACCASGTATLDVGFSIDAPSTVFITGTIGASQQGEDCSRVSVSVEGTASFNADDGPQCGTTGVPSEVQLDEAVPLDVVGNHSIAIIAGSSSDISDTQSAPDGAASWNLRIGFCSNDFTDGNDVITGTEEDDVLCGGGGNDEIDGGLGDNTILEGPGSDTLTGGDGNDTIEGSEGNDSIHGGEDNDTVRGGPGDDGDLTAIVDGGVGRDVIEGGPGDDVLYSAEFNDGLLVADNNNDSISGGSGKDVISASDNRGENTLNGDGGNDVIGGGEEADNIGGGDGHDEIRAGDGNDSVVHGGAGDDLIEGGPGNDVLRGEAGSDKLRRKGDNDCLVGGTRKDVFVGGPGNDRLLARDGVHDVLHGGPNFDRARFDQIKDDVDGVEDQSFQGGC